MLVFQRSKVKDAFHSKADNEDDDKDTIQNKYLNITLSTMYFTHSALPEEIQVKVSENHYRICFSFHSSLSEVCIEYLILSFSRLKWASSSFNFGV